MVNVYVWFCRFLNYYLRKRYLILSHCKKIWNADHGLSLSMLFLEAGETLMVLIKIQN